ncbi:Na+/H+ antiporter NhaA [Bradyrhizobium sp. USDA 4472]
MPKAAAPILSPISAPRIFTERSAVSAKHSDLSEFIGVAIFCGIGLLMSLVAVILGVQGAWY